MRMSYLLAALFLASGCTEDVAPIATNGSEEPPYFVVDKNATGPLTLEELKINIPDKIDSRLSDRKRECIFRAVARRAAEAGDPSTLDVDSEPYENGGADQAQWDSFSPYQQRLLLAQRVLHDAFREC